MAGSGARAAGERTDHFYKPCSNLRVFRIIFPESAFVTDDVVRSKRPAEDEGPFSLLTFIFLP